MDRRPKSKKSTASHTHDPDAPDSLVIALMDEFFAPENLNLVIPVTMFAVQQFFDDD
jgi:hypothetical protein